MYPHRFVLVPWGRIQQTDLEPQGDPETAVYLQGHDTLIGLHIRGLDTSVMLGIREDAQGAPQSCAIAEAIAIDTAAWQSNPRRRYESGEDA